MKEVEEQSRNNDALVKSQLYEKEQAITVLTQRNLANPDAIAALSDQIMNLIRDRDVKI